MTTFTIGCVLCLFRLLLHADTFITVPTGHKGFLLLCMFFCVLSYLLCHLKLTEWCPRLTAYIDSLLPCLVCVPSGTLSTLPSARNPHSHQMLLCVVVGSISCVQASIIPPHGAVGAKTGSMGGVSIPTRSCWQSRSFYRLYPQTGRFIGSQKKGKGNP